MAAVIRVLIGSNGVVEEWTWNGKFRTSEQFEAVREIVELEDFKFSCGSEIFKPGNPNNTYRGPVAFAYYTKDNKVHVKRIGKRGKILKHATA